MDKQLQADEMIGAEEKVLRHGGFAIEGALRLFTVALVGAVKHGPLGMSVVLVTNEVSISVETTVVVPVVLVRVLMRVLTSIRPD